MSSAAWGHQIDLLVRARTPLIWVRSNEEARVESLLGEAAQRLARQLVCWNFIDGISGPVNADGQGSRQPMAMLQWLQQRDAGSPTLLLAKDFHRFCDDPGVARMLRNLEASLRSTPHTLVLCCGQWTSAPAAAAPFQLPSWMSWLRPAAGSVRCGFARLRPVPWPAAASWDQRTCRTFWTKNARRLPAVRCWSSVAAMRAPKPSEASTVSRPG